MQRNDSVMASVEGLKQGNELAAHDLWNRYFSQLVALAKNKLPLHVKRSFDEEDVALSAFHSLCTGLQESRFPDLEDRDNLWAILVVITTRKAMRRMRTNTALKRGGGDLLGESVFMKRPSTRDFGIENIIGGKPTPEFADQLCEASTLLLESLPDESFKQIAQLKLAGYSVDEIATQTKRSPRTINRRLNLIRKIWKEHRFKSADEYE